MTSSFLLATSLVCALFTGAIATPAVAASSPGVVTSSDGTFLSASGYLVACDGRRLILSQYAKEVRRLNPRTSTIDISHANIVKVRLLNGRVGSLADLKPDVAIRVMVLSGRFGKTVCIDILS